MNASQVEVPDKTKSFNDLVWENCVRLGALKEDYSAAGVYAMTRFVGWSLDSSRLLIEPRRGDEKRSMQGGYLYFNTRRNTFEVTDYSRKLNKARSEPLGCSEPIDPLPSVAELKTRYEKLDQQLNKAYEERIRKIDKESVSNLRESQRNWIKHRDEGVMFYLRFTPAAEKERRRLQFLGDVTAARLEELNRPAEEI